MNLEMALRGVLVWPEKRAWDVSARETRVERTGLARRPRADMTPATLHTSRVRLASWSVNTSPLATTGTRPLAHETAKAIASRSTGWPEDD